MIFWNRRLVPDAELEAVAVRLRALPVTPVDAALVARARHRVLAALPQPEARRAPLPRLALAGAIAATLVTGAAGAALAAPAALPGDPLYGLKRAEEQLQLFLATSPAQAETIRQQHAAIRLQEQKALEARGHVRHTPSPGRGD